MASIGSLIADLRLNSAAFIRDMGKAQAATASNTAKMRKSMRAVEQSSRNVSKQFRQLRVGAAALGGALVLNKWVKAFTEVETSLQQIVGLVGIAQRDVDKFGKAILKLGPAVGKGPGELADALFFITSAGLKGTQAMEALTVSAKAATAGLGETKSVADAVTSAMNAYATSNLSAAQATDVLVATVREGKLEASELASSIGQVLAVAENAAVKFHEVGASVAALTRIGIKTAEAVTGLRGVLVALAKESKAGSDVLKEYGLSYEGLRQSIREKGLLTTLTDLRKVIGTNETALVKIFGRVEAVTTILALTGANAEQVRGVFDRMADSTGALDKAFGAVANTAEFKFNAGLAKLTAQAIELGSVVIPSLANAAKFAADNFRQIAAVLTTVVAFKAAAIFIGIATAVWKFTASLVAARTASIALMTVMKFNPIALALGLVAGAAVLLATNTSKAEEAARLHKEAIDAVKAALDDSNPKFESAAKTARELALADITAAEARLELLDALIASQGVGMLGNVTATTGQLAAIKTLQERIKATKQGLVDLTAQSKKLKSVAIAVNKAMPLIDPKEAAAAKKVAAEMKKVTDALKVQAHQQRLLADALRVSEEEYERVAEAIELANAAAKLNKEATDEQVNAWTDAFRESQKYRKELEDVRTAQDEAAQAAKDHAEEQKRLAEQQREILLEPFKNAIRGIQDAFTGLFEKIFSGGINSTKDFVAAMKQIFIRLAAELAAVMVIKPVLGSIAGAIGGSVLGGGGGGGGDGGGIIGGIAKSVVSSAIGEAIGLPSIATALGFGAPSVAAAALPGAVVASTAGVAGALPVAGGAGAFGGLGAAAAALGPIGIAALIGGGLFLGSKMFGGSTKTPRAGARVHIEDKGLARVGATGETGGGDIGLNVAEAQRAADTLNEIARVTGGFLNTFTASGQKIGIQATTRSESGQLTRTAEDIVRDALTMGVLQGVSQEKINDILQNGLQSFEDAAKEQADAAAALAAAAEEQKRAAAATLLAAQQTVNRNVLGAAGSISQFINQQRLQNVSPAAGLVEAQRQFGEGLSKVRGGDLGATQNLLGSARDLLAIGRQNFASTTSFQAIDRMVQSSLLGVAEQITSDEFINAQVEATRQQTEVLGGELESIKAEVAALRGDIRRQTLALEAA